MTEEKKEVRIPRLWVYLSAFAAGMVCTTAFGLAFGVTFALDFITSACLYGCIFIVASNVMDKVERQPYRLTVKYWILIALILLTDFLFLFAAKAETKEICIMRLCIFAVGLIFTGFYAYCIYAPSQKALFEEVKAAATAGIAQYINEHLGEAPEAIAEGILAIILAPKVKEKKVKEKKVKKAKKGEEANE